MTIHLCFPFDLFFLLIKLVACLELWTAEIAPSAQQNTPEICKAFWNLPLFTSAVIRSFGLSETLEVSAQISGLVPSQQILSKAGREHFPYHNPSLFGEMHQEYQLWEMSAAVLLLAFLQVWVVLGRPGGVAELAPRLWRDLSAEWASRQAAVPTVIPTQLSARQAISISNSRTLYPDPRYLTLLRY